MAGHSASKTRVNALGSPPSTSSMLKKVVEARYKAGHDGGCGSALLDHFARELTDARRHGDAKRLRGLEIDHELELGRDLHWQLGRPRAFEDARRVAAGDAIVLVDVGTEADQAAGMRIFAIGKD